MNQNARQQKLSDSFFEITYSILESSYSSALVNNLLQLVESLIVAYYVLLSVRTMAGLPESFDIFRMLQVNEKVD